MEIVGLLAAVGLAAAGALHAVWAFSPWPAVDRTTLAKVVLGDEGEGFPWAPACVGMAAVLAAAGYVVAARSGLLPVIGPRQLYTVGAWTIAAGLLARGSVFPAVITLRGRSGPEFKTWDLRVYTPVCLVLGGLSLAVALS
ncbi:DUF3995 domain-containing protein [Streptosporangium sp. NPDC000396]|uniref:DUF3995 domain-containing protein n=1 Tax=Streptosporangium sp. NPDC000396 TaxID=3366185 RepID=UPI0036C05029